MKYILFILLIASSCTSVKGIERDVTLVKKERVLENMYVSYRLVFSDGSVRTVNNADQYLYEVGRCYLIR